jgi:hypothetical protein
MSAATRTLSRRRNALVRHRGLDDPVTLDADRALRAVQLEEHIQRVVDAAPPLTQATRERLALLLYPGAGNG